MTTPAHDTLFGALARAIDRARAVGKDAKNSFHGYKYASAEAVIEEARGALAAEGLSVLPLRWGVLPVPVGVAATPTRETPAPVAVPTSLLSVTYMLAHASGQTQTIETEWGFLVEKGRPADKAIAGALTTSLSYLLRGLLLLPREDEATAPDRRDDRAYDPHARSATPPARQSATSTPVHDPPAASATPPAAALGVQDRASPWFAKVAACGTVRDLTALASEIKAAGLDDATKAAVMPAYLDRKRDLSNGGAR